MRTIKDVEKLLNPRYVMNKPFIVSEKDYKWIRKIIKPNRYGIVRYLSEDVYFDTLKTKTKSKKLKCLKCGKSTGSVKFFSMTNDMQTLKPYHLKCFNKVK